MKHIAVIIFALVISKHISSQTYEPFPTSAQDPHWSYASWVGPGYPMNYWFYNMSGDTMLMGNTYSKLYQSSIPVDQYQGCFREDSLKRVYFVEAGDSVDKLLYDFSVGLGDTVFNIWCHGVGYWQLDTTFVAIYDSIQAPNSLYYDHFQLYDVGGTGDYLIWHEGIGSLDHLFMQNIYGSVSGTFWLSCFYNNEGLSYYYSGSDNCYFNTEEPSIDWITIYPNPANDFILINNTEFANAGLYQILNVNGQVVVSGNLTMNQIPVYDLKLGVYVLQIMDDQHTYLAKFIKN